MSIKNIPTLQQLAVQSLLSNQALAISALEFMPTNFFPPLFKEAFDGRHLGLLKAMVAAWPFACLPVGALMKTPDVEALQAVLEGLDMLQSQKVRPRRWKLQVLDLRNVHHDFLGVWTGPQAGAHSTETGSEKQVGRYLPRYVLRPRLKVVTDFSFRFQLKEHQTCLLQWAQQRKGSVRLCCLRMTICALPVEIIKKVLDIFHPHYIEELELFTNQVLPFLGHFASCLGRMRNLHKFRLTQIYLSTDRVVCPILTYTEEKCAIKFLSQFSKLNCLQHFSMNGVSFSSDHMKHLFRCLKTPLESLCITLCQLSQSYLKHLSQCLRLCHLKHLNLNGVELSKIRPTHLRVLLENVADTLQNLELMQCRMKDSQLSALLPALSQCSQLTRVNFYDNNLSMAVLKDLLQSMANLSKLTVELYPAPLECYDRQGYILVEKFTQVCPELWDIVTAQRQPKSVAFATRHCLECYRRCVYDMESTLCWCWQ
ncbi:PRAME family member 12-like [Peromyscus californicus insignis]|uniref:PRAME family member 12-like n=1 Tax=Peromyscus californicus insignis TaxID=564181 RepID=UPI0022A7A5E9|nr:PRAME family member 12-like [Peromyscus californicus insignis]